MNDTVAYSALVVDDDDEVRRLLTRALVAQGIQVDSAPNGLIATEIMARKAYDALITDLRMPKKHGHQLVAEILEKPGPAPLIFVLTGLPEPKLALDLFERGVDSVDYKPLHFAAFAAKVRGLLLRRDKLSPPISRPEVPLAVAAPAPTGHLAAQLKDDIASITSTFESAIARLKEQQSQLEDGYLGSVRMLTGLVGNIGESKGVHASRVERMAAYIGERVGLDQQSQRNLKVASLLHEIGQFGMPDTIRGKAAWRLPDDVREQYEKYPAIGAALLSEMPGTDEIVRLVECHAENFDGSGFPNRLSGEDIPLGARIIRLADAYDTYLMFLEEGKGREDAIQYLAERRGKIHDPALFKYAMAYLDELAAEESSKEVQVVNVLDLREGMELAESLFDSEGRFLAREGVKLTAQLAERLHRLIPGHTVQVMAKK